MGLEPTTPHVTGECSNQLSYDRKYLLLRFAHSNRKRAVKQTRKSSLLNGCRREGSNLRPHLYEWCALTNWATPTYYSIFRKLSTKSQYTILPLFAKMPTIAGIFASLLRGPESNGRLQVMSLMRYRFSTPLWLKHLKALWKRLYHFYQILQVWIEKKREIVYRVEVREKSWDIRTISYCSRTIWFVARP